MIMVLFFGLVVDAAGLRSFTLVAEPACTVADVLAQVAERHPEARRLITVVALDGERIAPADFTTRQLPDGAELVFMAMFSGG